MSNEAISIIAVLKAKPGQQDALRQALQALLLPTRQEPGNLDYALFQLRDAPDTFYMRESWRNQEALDAHVALPHFQNFIAQMNNLLAEPLRLDINALYVDDEGIITSAGTAAALDCCLYLIRQRFGSLVANQIARRMIVPPHREGGQAQFIAQPVPKNTRDARINGLLEYLQQHIREPHNLDSLAQVAAMSRRTLTRHFAKATGMGIADWLAAERLRRSQILLEAGDLPVGQVAEEVGYRSAVTWRQQFKARFGVSPAEWRRTFRRGA